MPISTSPGTVTPREHFQVLVVGRDGVHRKSVIERFGTPGDSWMYDVTYGEEPFDRLMEVDQVLYHFSVYRAEEWGLVHLAAPHLPNIQDKLGIILVYSVASRESFNRVNNLHHSIITKIKREELGPIGLVGNECDVDDSLRQVPAAEGSQLATRLGIDFFVETDGQADSDVDYLFVKLARALAAQKLKARSAALTASEEEVKCEEERESWSSRVRRQFDTWRNNLV